MNYADAAKDDETLVNLYYLNAVCIKLKFLNTGSQSNFYEGCGLRE